MASESPQVDRTAPPPATAEQTSPSGGDSAKRKAEQTNGTHTRTKRNRYISIAWYDLPSAFLGNQIFGGGLTAWPVTNANDARSNVTAKCRANAVAT